MKFRMLTNLHVRKIMNFRVFAAFAVLICVAHCDVSKPSDVNDTSDKISSDQPTNTDTNVTSSVLLKKMCDICDCIGGIYNCSSRSLDDHFAASQWPTTSIIIDTITFEGNSITHLLEFPNVTISRLILSHNRINKIDDNAFKFVVNLTELDLSHNQITSENFKPQIFAGKFSPEAYQPIYLRVLNLANNVLHTLHRDIFEHTDEIRKLNLSGNPFHVIDRGTELAISSLPYLEELDLSYCDLELLPTNIFHNSKLYLKRLNLNSNKLTEVPKALIRAEALVELYMNENPIVTLDEENGFPAVKKLREVSMCCMPLLKQVKNGAFSQLTGLETLLLHNSHNLTKIEDFALSQETAEGRVWPPLKKLDLSDNALRYLPTMLVARTDELEELDLMNNQWSCDCNNQYLIGELLPSSGKKWMGEKADKLKCAGPNEMAGQTLTSLADHHLRCLDVYGAQPERDASVLVGMLVGLLLALPCVVAIFILWRKGYFVCGSGPASFSRAFYNRAANDDEI